MTSRWRFFSKAAIAYVRLPGSGRWIGVAHFLGFKVACAAKVASQGFSLLDSISAIVAVWDITVASCS
jgi:hypothetical protein